ncbi:succinylglutamate desuccinylase/aspartoacylase family protein [Streptomyces sp. NBC_00201]|uniref:succinylglutamate desuccinylase/aspartoacylase family protein n=1 Tax=unclassified Streptomyces TaxID=2593676 RepID=UPI00225853CD|nr:MULTISPECIES: succinylglutamate desuccinylase/aspartoacylase family protein [unclassified Streptomyces]MCX5250591.1 succinylglutamate desuccinylase/aspartoacylase family protein [Streptomyces sp. NBC_00201]MCX5291480.1 succinylglutamate desuccinylase/aspartoacylase family protein [Streptomyces sp. NBC_00183]
MTSTKSSLSVGALSAQPGSKVRGTVPADLGTLTVDIPLTLVNGAHPGPRVLVTAGVHGGEFTGIDAATRLAALLEPGEVHGQVVVCPVANPSAVYQGRLGVSPVDGVNINRVFPGDPDGGPTERLAAWLFTHLVEGADAYVDLHSGGIDEVLKDFVGYRLTGDSELDGKTADMAGALGIEDVIFGMNADGGNSHAAAARQGIPAILVETGQLGERDPEAARRLLGGLYGVLSRLGVLDTRPQDPASPVREWVWAAGVTAENSGLWYPEFTAGDDVTAGQVIGHVIDPADGQEHKVHTPATGRIFYGMRGLTVAPGAELAAIAAPAPRDCGDH